MTQAQFSASYHLPLSTLRDWEQARTRPDAPARALLTAIYNDAETMRRLVNGAKMGGTDPDAKAAPRVGGPRNSR